MDNKIYTIEPWNMAFLAKAARQAHTRAIGWKNKYKAVPALHVMASHYHANYLAERSYARGLMLCLTSVAGHKSAFTRRWERKNAEKMRREYVV